MPTSPFLATYDPSLAWEQLLHGHGEYLRHVSPNYDDVLRVVIDNVERSGSIGKADIGALLFWKRLRADSAWVRALHEWPDPQVREITARAVTAVQDTDATLSVAARAGRSELAALPGFATGDALASALLLAAAPTRMAVYDRRSDAGLKSLGVQVGSTPGRYGRYMAIIDKLLESAPPDAASWHPRNVDEALYWLGGLNPAPAATTRDRQTF